MWRWRMSSIRIFCEGRIWKSKMTSFLDFEESFGRSRFVLNVVIKCFFLPMHPLSYDSFLAPVPTTGDSWSEMQVLYDTPDPWYGDAFGYSVSIDETEGIILAVFRSKSDGWKQDNLERLFWQAVNLTIIELGTINVWDQSLFDRGLSKFSTFCFCVLNFDHWSTTPPR